MLRYFLIQILRLSLVNDFPIKYSSDNVKLYKIPSILYSDSNYHLVSGLNGYPSKQPVFIDVDPSPTVIFPTNQSTFWEVTALDEGKGSIGLPVLSEDSVEACGNRRLMISVGSGTYSRWQIKHSFNVSQDWSQYDYLGFYWFGTNTSATLSLGANSQLSGYNYQRYDFVDNWIGWKLLVAPLNKPDESSAGWVRTSQE